MKYSYNNKTTVDVVNCIDLSKWDAHKFRSVKVITLRKYPEAVIIHNPLYQM
jgi:hypothetical protein